MRKTRQELEKIKEKYNVATLYSWSRYNTYKNSCFEYYLKYITKTPEDRSDGIYGISGNAAHNILEKFYSKEITYDEMLPKYEDELFKFNMAELKYDRTNEEKNKLIAQKYEYCLRHFFQSHNIINKKVEIERFILIKINNFMFHGYIDFIFKDGEDVVIVDWKTSSIYTGKKIDKEKGQLILYAEGLRQLGIKIENIKVLWNFLKYVTIEVEQANGETKERHIARNEIGESLTANAKMWLKKEKIYTDEQIENYLDLLKLTNDIKNLPENIQLKYKIKDCYVNIPFNQEEIDNLKTDIVDTIADISKKESNYAKTKDENIWWEEVTNNQSYYFANLSGFSAKLHKPYGAYLDELNKYRNQTESSNENDLSWLDEI